MRIAVDAMGSDDRPAPDVEGAVMAARDFNLGIALVGPQDTIEAELAKHDTSDLAIEIVHAGEVITMTDKPAESAKAKQNSSMHVGMRLVETGEADAFVSAGNTGAALAVATLHTLKRVSGVKRPALCAVFRNMTGYTIICDFGANADCKPEYLLQFAQMADVYTRRALKIEEPRVALLSNGEEEGKGDELVRSTTPLMKDLPGINYVGNVEPKEVLKGETDIVVADGFVGNIMGKSFEAMASYMGTVLREELTANPVRMVGAALVKPGIDSLRARLDPEDIGGVPLLGVNGVVIIAHGRSSAKAIRNAVRQAKDAVDEQIVTAIRSSIGAG